MSAACCEEKNKAGLVSLRDLIDAVEAQSDTVSSYLDLSTGEIYAISEEAFRIADEDTAAGDMIPDWQQEEVEWARIISASDRYIALPTSWDVHEWDIMHQFCYSLPDQRWRAEFLSAIQGRGAFRHFKNQLTHHDLWESWHPFRRQALSALVIEWCQEHSVSFVA
jgi:hypothetical protein